MSVLKDNVSLEDLDELIDRVVLLVNLILYNPNLLSVQALLILYFESTQIAHFQS